MAARVASTGRYVPMRKVILVILIFAAAMVPSAAQAAERLTRPQARAALQTFVDRYPEIDTTRIDRCKWRATRRLWTCRLYLAGTSSDGFAVDGGEEPARFEARWRYRISGSCRSARVELAELFLTEPARRFNVCWRTDEGEDRVRGFLDLKRNYSSRS